MLSTASTEWYTTSKEIASLFMHPIRKPVPEGLHLSTTVHTAACLLRSKPTEFTWVYFQVNGNSITALDTDPLVWKLTQCVLILSRYIKNLSWKPDNFYGATPLLIICLTCKLISKIIKSIKITKSQYQKSAVIPYYDIYW